MYEYSPLVKSPTGDLPTSLAMDRRQLLSILGLAAAGIPLHESLVTTTADAVQPRAANNRFPQMVHEYFVQQVRRAIRRNVEAYQRLKTPADAQAYIESVRHKIRDCFGPEPERTELNARTTGTVEREAYTIEKVIFESRPGFPVTANLYLPKNVGVPSSGSHRNLRALAQRQRGGRVPVLRPGTGSARLCLPDLRPDRTGRATAVCERGPLVAHRRRCARTSVRRQPTVPGRRVSGHVAGLGRHPSARLPADTRRSRPAARRRHRQFGWRYHDHLAVRCRAAVDDGGAELFCHVVSSQLENELPADTEQCPPKALALGLDHADFLAAMAPKPVMILAKERDYFDVRGSREASSSTEASLHVARPGRQHRPVCRSHPTRLHAGEP